MKIHHLNCGTMHPIGAPDGLVCHVLLVEAADRLVLVDSGLGLRDAADPAGRFGPSRRFVRPVFDEGEAAITQVTDLGFDPPDVTDIILTHFDADHIGGLADFPWARVHLTAAEADAALHPRTIVEKGRYLAAGRDHGPELVRHTPGAGEAWRDFAAAKELTDVAAGIVLVSLPGHTRGHAAIAVESSAGWILHCGDAFYHHGQLDGTSPGPVSLRMMEQLIAVDLKRVRANHERLQELWRRGDPDLLLVNAHDPTLLRWAQSGM